MLVLEREDAAQRRGAQAIAEVCGFGISAEGYHITSPAPDGHGALAAMRAALDDAGARPEEPLYVNAHGTATTLNDAAEAVALMRLFGDRATQAPVSSTKGATGHTLAAAGALEVAISALALHEGFVPATLRLDRPDPAFALDLVAGVARPERYDLALSNSFAFGGHNTAVVLRSAG
jgi:3-oxoacyl-[acyl-carrier-protein] synthase II